VVVNKKTMEAQGKKAVECKDLRLQMQEFVKSEAERHPVTAT
jgi:hypothetical protein